MMTRMVVVLGLVVSLAAGADAAQAIAAQPADAVALKPVFTKDDAFAYTFKLESNVRWSGGGAEEGGAEAGAVRRALVVHEGVLRLHVLDIDEDGAATMSAALSRLEIEWEFEDTEAPPGKASVRFARKGEPREVPPEPDADEPRRKGVLERVGAAVFGAAIRFEVGTDGRVRDVTGLDAAMEAAADEELGQWALGAFGAGSMGRMLERLWVVDEPVEDDDGALVWPRRRDGDAWTLHEERPLAYGNVVRIERSFTYARRGGAPDTVRMQVSGEGALAPRTGDPDPTVPILALNEWREECELIFDPARGRCRRLGTNVITEIAATLGARSQTTRVDLTAAFWTEGEWEDIEPRPDR